MVDLGVVENARLEKRSELLHCLEERDWPACDMRTIGASTSLARHGVIGPGREAWERFCGYLDSRQLNHIVLMLVHNPAVFTDHLTNKEH